MTIGVLDEGVGLATPALQKMTTGERKIVDWVTVTDSIFDGTWRPMITSVTGPTFNYGGETWKVRGGSYRMNILREDVTAGGKVTNGDTSDNWGADPAAVDVGDNGDVNDDTPTKPYKDGYQIGHCGADDPATTIAESQGVVVQAGKDVPMDPLGGDGVGKKADFVDIGLVPGAHGTHLVSIIAASSMFNGRMGGAALGAKIVCEMACLFGVGCNSVVMAEGIIDLVNMSIGGMPALNDGSSATAQLYNRLIDTYGVEFVIAVGNSGRGANTIEDRAWPTRSSGAPLAFPSRLSPPTTPVAEVGTFLAWMLSAMEGHPGWTCPSGYVMWDATSMAPQQVAGASALLPRKAAGHRTHACERAHGACLDRPTHQRSSGVRGRRRSHRGPRHLEGGRGGRDRPRLRGEGIGCHRVRPAAEDAGLRHGRLRPRGRPEGWSDVRHHPHSYVRAVRPLLHLLRLAHLSCRVSGRPGLASRAGSGAEADDAVARGDGAYVTKPQFRMTRP
ncbi:S8/S53 family peptidase [Streptomyces sp. NPDC006668]|uniref:S8/S53 family peptidase n=1 Tax=Streptomyces sp. NPDC006668 TaxID=3156903 RepID=UPI0033D09898